MNSHVGAAAAGAAVALAAVAWSRRPFSYRAAHTLRDGTCVILRSARACDVHALWMLTRDLAVVCDELHELVSTEAMLHAAFRAADFEALVVERDGEVVGAAFFQPSFRTWSGASLYLQDLIVAERHRGAGLGTLLLSALAALALSRGCDRLFWESTVENAKARAFYASPAIGAHHAAELMTWKLIGREKLAALAAQCSP